MPKINRKAITKKLYRAANKFLAIRDARSRNSSCIFKEVHLTHKLRVDVLHLTWKDEVTIIELKSCKEDFRGDHKWKGYLDYCDYFWFMCPYNAVSVDELPPRVGLIYVGGDDKNPTFQIVKGIRRLKPKKLTPSWFRYIYKKLAFRKTAIFQGKIFSVEDMPFFDKE